MLKVILLLSCLGILSPPAESSIYREDRHRRQADYNAVDVLEKNKNISLYRLPKNAIPISYALLIDTDMEINNSTFNGDINITINVLVETNNLTLHARNLKINGITLMTNGSKLFVEPITYSISNITNFLSIAFEQPIPTGIHVLNLNYTGIFNDETMGCYRYSYEDSNGGRSWMTSTHLQLINARSVFPCWDEPALTAKFSIAINHNEKYTAFSNMHALKITKNKNPTTVTTYFATTPAISTYTVDFIIANFTCIEKRTNIIIRICGRNTVINNNNNTNFYLNLSIRTLRSMEEFTGIPPKEIGFEKIDIIVIPSAMSEISTQYFGVIVVSETLFLGDMVSLGYLIPRKEIMGLDIMTRVIVQGLGSIWFNNFITPNWWSELWINGFATYLMHVISNQINEEWRLMDRMVTYDLQFVAFEMDNNKDVRALIESINMENIECIDLHENIVTDLNTKAGSIIYMFSQILGQKEFQWITRELLKTNAHRPVSSKNVIDAFEKYAGNEINSLREIMNNWLTTPGYPVINCTRNYTTGHMEIVQSRFYADSGDKSAEKYWIPINYATGDNRNFDDTSVSHWLSPADKSIKISGFTKNKWIIVNKQNFGYYRVNYDEENWRLIIKSLKARDHGGIPVLNRVQLINDAVALAGAKQLDYSIVYSLIGYLQYENDPLPWIKTLEITEPLINNIVKNPSYRKYFEKYMTTVSKEMKKHLPIEDSADERYLVKYYKYNILQFICQYAPTLCVTEATEALQKWLNNSEKYPLPNSVIAVDSVSCVAGRNIDEKVWDDLLKLWHQRHDDFMLNILICGKNITQVEKLFTEINEQNIDIEQFDNLFVTINNGKGQIVMTDAAIHLLINNWDKIIKLYENYEFLIKDVISFAVIFSEMKNETLNKLEEFIKTTESFRQYVTMDDVAMMRKNRIKPNAAFEKFMRHSISQE